MPWFTTLLHQRFTLFDSVVRWRTAAYGESWELNTVGSDGVVEAKLLDTPDG
jgi:hypothetical protein